MADALSQQREAVHRVEYRACGISPITGSWAGAWEPSIDKNEMGYLAKFNEVWVERREVWEMPAKRIEISEAP